LAKTGPRAQRRRIEVSQDDPALRSYRLWAVQVRSCSGRRHLPHLLGNALGAPGRRVAIFLDLRGQGAGTAALEVTVEHTTHASGGGQRKAAPFDGGIAIGILQVQKIAILDEPKRIDQNGRNLLEALVSGRRERRGFDGGAPRTL